LFLDMAWFGVLSGSTIAFVAVYATRIGATNAQIGLLSALPALVNLLFALPAGSWLSRRRLGRAVFWTSILSRLFYLVLVPLPVLLMPEAQIQVILFMTLLMSIPGTALVVGFNSQFGEVVPLEWRGYVAGIRNALLSLISIAFTMISGWILGRLEFPTGYQVVFAIGVLGAGMSSLHLYLLSAMKSVQNGQGNGLAQPRTVEGRKLAQESRALLQRGMQSLRLDAMRGHFARIMALLFAWHLAQWMTIPIVTPFIVNELHLSDQLIALTNSLFNTTVFFGSLNLSNVTRRFGNKRLMAIGVMTISLFPILTSLGVGAYFAANIIGGIAWSLIGGVTFNYILENTPADDRPAHLAWYTLVLNAAILTGSLAGPAIAGTIGYTTALLLFGFARFIAGAAILRWG
ncbi:MAG: MFS transporter, partial [Chloroflexi bacterium]